MLSLLPAALWLSMGGKATAAAPHPALGNFLEFMAMICAAGYTILMKQLSKELHPFFLTGLQAFAGALFFAPALLLPSVRAASLSVNGWLAVLYLGTVVSVGAYGLYNFGISRIPASQASAFVNLIPVFSIVLGFVVLGERLDFLAMDGLCPGVQRGIVESGLSQLGTSSRVRHEQNPAPHRHLLYPCRIALALAAHSAARPSSRRHCYCSGKFSFLFPSHQLRIDQCTADDSFLVVPEIILLPHSAAIILTLSP